MSASSVSDLLREGVVPIPEIPILREYTHDGIAIWIRKGRKALSGRTVRLEAVRLPNEWRTSPQAVARFFAALAEESCELAVA